MTALRNSLLASLALIATTTPLTAAETRPFDRTAFVAAQAAGKPILVAVKAWWCPVCASQGGTIRNTIKDTAYANLVVFQINYDKQKSELPAFQVRKQGTILAYRGTTQVGRLDFVTDKPRIRALIAQTLR
jgi:thioredoxin 1